MRLSSLVERVHGYFRRDSENVPRRQAKWEDAQKYELDSAIHFMNSEHFRLIINKFNDSENSVSRGFVDELTLVEFFGNNLSRWKDFVEHIKDKTVLEIGPCVASQLSLWDVASSRYVIDPLYDDIVKYQQNYFGETGFVKIKGFSVPAEHRVDELVGRVDGALLIRNCLDHTPLWPFVLSNITEYMVKGSYLLLWNDLHHPPGYEEGHYDITSNIDLFRRLIENLGFELVLEYQNQDSPCINFGCLAVRK